MASHSSTTKTAVLPPKTGSKDVQQHGVRVVTTREYKQAAACLAEAFAEDHVVRYSIDTPDNMHLSEEARFKIHKESLEYVTYAHCLNGLVLTTGEDFDCVALWLPPGKNIDDWWTILRSGMWRLYWKLTAEGRERFFREFLPLLGKSKAEVMGDRDGDSWYLNYVGTKSNSRGKGYARQLIEHVTKQADTNGKASYLESSHAVNLKIYGKLGFEVKREIFLLRGPEPIKMDVMVREPRSNEVKQKA